MLEAAYDANPGLLLNVSFDGSCSVTPPDPEAPLASWEPRIEPPGTVFQGDGRLRLERVLLSEFTRSFRNSTTLRRLECSVVPKAADPHLTIRYNIAPSGLVYVSDKSTTSQSGAARQTRPPSGLAGIRMDIELRLQNGAAVASVSGIGRPPSELKVPSRSELTRSPDLEYPCLAEAAIESFYGQLRSAMR
jgi:hypothetical protein